MKIEEPTHEKTVRQKHLENVTLIWLRRAAESLSIKDTQRATLSISKAIEAMEALAHEN